MTSLTHLRHIIWAQYLALAGGFDEEIVRLLNRR